MKQPQKTPKKPSIPVESIAKKAVLQMMLSIIAKHGYATRPHWEARRNEQALYDYACKLAAKHAAFSSMQFISDGAPMPQHRVAYDAAIKDLALQLEWKRVDSNNELK